MNIAIMLYNNMSLNYVYPNVDDHFNHAQCSVAKRHPVSGLLTNHLPRGCKEWRVVNMEVECYQVKAKTSLPAEEAPIPNTWFAPVHTFSQKKSHQNLMGFCCFRGVIAITIYPFPTDGIGNHLGTTTRVCRTAGSTHATHPFSATLF